MIRSLFSDDFAACRALWARCEGLCPSVDDEDEGLHRFTMRNPGLSVVWDASGSVLGTLLVGHDGRRGYLYHLAVDPEARRQGIARLLVGEGIARLREEGIVKVHAQVMAENVEARLFWQEAGFHERTELGLFSKLL